MPENTDLVKGFFSSLCGDNSQVLFVRMKGGAPVHELRTWDDGLDVLPGYNNIGWDCFYTVGVTDGSGYRRADNMVSPRALFIDLDTPAVSQAALEFWMLQDNSPSAVVNTSPGKFHLYWFIEGKLGWPTWTHYQKVLAAWTNAKFGPKTADASVCDAPRIMRLPGSLHHKGEPYRGSVVSLSSRTYSLEELATAFPKPSPYVGKTRNVTSPDSLWARAKIEAFRRVLLRLEVVRESAVGYTVICPNSAAHTTVGDEAMLYAPSEANDWSGGFKCLHAHCFYININHLRSCLGAS